MNERLSPKNAPPTTAATSIAVGCPVYIKSSEGETLVDDYYRVNIEGAKRAGLKVGSYHYYRPDANADLQFQNITSQVRKEEQDLAPIIDIEKRGTKSQEEFINGLRDFLVKMEKHYGCKPVIYTFHNFYNKYLSGYFKGYRMMIARYREDEPTLDDDQPYTAWQYTQRGKIDGIKGYVDRSMVMRDFSVSDLSIGE
jgi:lysozyme